MNDHEFLKSLKGRELIGLNVEEVERLSNIAAAQQERQDHFEAGERERDAEIIRERVMQDFGAFRHALKDLVKHERATPGVDERIDTTAAMLAQAAATHHAGSKS